MVEFWLRLKQRKLVQWAIAWAAFAFALLQGVDIVAQRFIWPASVERYLILALAIGFFVVLVLAWYHGERGAQRVGGMEIMILALLLAVGGGLIWRFGAAAKIPHIALAAAAAQAIPEKSVAVLPFANESGNKDEQFFSDGLSEDLITALSQFAGLKVISRDSAFQFRDSKDPSAKVGKLLGVAHLLEGSVQRVNNEVRITATLVNAADGSILWSQRYDKSYKDLFALQDAITHSVADALKAKLLTTRGAVVQSDRPPSGNLPAYAAYQHGVADDALNTEVGTHRAIEAYTEAIRLDSRYAAAFARLSEDWMALSVQYASADASQAIAKARAASQTALALDPDLAAAHLAHAQVLENVDLDWHGAETEAQRALQLAPHDASAQGILATVKATLGDNRRAVELMRSRIAADPRSAGGYSGLSVYLAALGRLEEARQAIEKTIALQPVGVANYEGLAVIDILRGDAKSAQAAAEQEPPGPWNEIALALALQIGPDRAAAEAALKALIAKYEGSAPYQIAEVYALRKDPDAMFKWLDRAWTERDPGIGKLLLDPLILRYQHAPRFAAFCKKVGLPTTTDAVAMK